MLFGGNDIWQKWQFSHILLKTSLLTAKEPYNRNHKKPNAQNITYLDRMFFLEV